MRYLIYMHSPWGTAQPRALCIYIRQRTLACVITYTYVAIVIVTHWLVTFLSHSYSIRQLHAQLHQIIDILFRLLAQVASRPSVQPHFCTINCFQHVCTYPLVSLCCTVKQ